MKSSHALLVCLPLLGGACDRGSASSTATAEKPTATAPITARPPVAPPARVTAATPPTTAPAAADTPAPASGKDRGAVTVKALLDGFKKEPKAWVGSTVAVKGSVTSYTENKFTYDKTGVHGPDKSGTYFGVYVTDPGAPRGSESVGCFLPEGKPLADVRAAFGKKNVLEEEVVVEISGPIEASFGAIAPCKIAHVAIAKRKKK